MLLSLSFHTYEIKYIPGLNKLFSNSGSNLQKEWSSENKIICFK
jgi:hypothetical protein